MPQKIDLGFDVRDLERVLARIEKIASPRKFNTILEKGTRRGLSKLRKHIDNSIERRVYRRAGYKQYAHLNRPRTGRLKQYSLSVEKYEGVPSGVFLHKQAHYAAAHEFGAVIRPKSAKFLTIPISPEAVGRSAREFSPKIWLPRDNPKIMATRRGKELIPLFALKEQVVVREKAPFRKGISDGMPEYVESVREVFREEI